MAANFPMMAVGKFGTGGGYTMKAPRKFIAIGMCGIMLGGISSVMMAPAASARFYNCDQRIDTMDKKSAQDYKKGRISEAEYLKIQADIAEHREVWGC